MPGKCCFCSETTGSSGLASEPQEKKSVVIKPALQAPCLWCDTREKQLFCIGRYSYQHTALSLQLPKYWTSSDIISHSHKPDPWPTHLLPCFLVLPGSWGHGHSCPWKLGCKRFTVGSKRRWDPIVTKHRQLKMRCIPPVFLKSEFFSQKVKKIKHPWLISVLFPTATGNIYFKHSWGQWTWLWSPRTQNLKFRSKERPQKEAGREGLPQQGGGEVRCDTENLPVHKRMLF